MVSNVCKKVIGKPRASQEVQNSTIIRRSWTDGGTMKQKGIFFFKKKTTEWDAAKVERLDYLNKVDISYRAPHYQTSRYEHRIALKSVDPDVLAGPMAKKEDHKNQML